MIIVDEMIDDILFQIARLNLIKVRIMNWLSLFNTLMIGTIFIRGWMNEWKGVLFFVVGLAVIIGIGILDYKYLYPKEMELNARLNPEWQRMMRKL